MNKPFLASVAEDMINRWGNNLSHVTIVLPGKRASLFMNGHLYQAAGKPVWAPRYVTIDELFLSLSPLKKCQPIRAICRLHNIYRQEMERGGVAPEHIMSVDKFYGWGEIMLADFDDVDKHLVDARRLFTNASDLARLESNDFLTPEQHDALNTFFTSMRYGEETLLKKHFLDIWNVMPTIYKRFNEELTAEGMGYPGMIFRGVAEMAKCGKLPIPEDRQYAFVGFNVLDDVEIALFEEFKQRNQATFYWDYDVYYYNEENKGKKHEAGTFMRQNVKLFPNALTPDLFDNLRKPKQIRMLACTTDNAQMRYLPKWVNEKLGTRENESAIVLCNESLIRPLLNSLPGKDDAEEATSAGINHIPNHVNITMGFPLTDTPIYGYLLSLLDLQTYGWDAGLGRMRESFVKRVTDNPFWTEGKLDYQKTSEDLFNWLSEEMAQLSRKVDEMRIMNGKLRQLYTESIFQSFCILNQFGELLTDESIRVLQRITLYRLVRRALNSVSVPFHGEEDKGLQVMGLLEARNLDFKNIVMTSVEEGFLPKSDNDTSLIPYNLKAAFHLSTIERKTAVFAYYFYRTIQRADDITLLFNDNSSGATQREMSRFLRQLQIESGLPFTLQRLEPELRTEKPVEMVIEKTPEIMRRMTERFEEKPGGGHALSPSAINNYLRCPISFFYQNVMGLEVPLSLKDGFSPILFGNLFHDSAELFYNHLQRLIGSHRIEATHLERFQKKEQLLPYVKLVFWLDYFKGEEYDSYRKRDDRDTFIESFLQAPTAEQFARQVSELYYHASFEGEGTFSGMSTLVRDTIVSLLRNLLLWDKAHAPFELQGNEESINDVIEIKTSETVLKLRIGGRVDRMDRMKIDGVETIRIVDYKTGKNQAKSGVESVKNIFDCKNCDKVHYYLQTFLYAIIQKKKNTNNMPVCPALFYVREAHDSAYNPYLSVGKQNVMDMNDETCKTFTEEMRKLLTEIFEPTIPFKQRETGKTNCDNCSYKQLCNK